MEWFISFELIRLILLYRQLKIAQPEVSKKVKFIEIIKGYLPVAGFVVIFLVVRLFIFKSARSTTDIGETIHHIIQAPVDFFVNVLIRTFQNFISEIFAAWVVPLSRLFNQTNNKDLLFGILVGFSGYSGYLFFFFAHRL